ncbi:MAG: hypothetical protein JXN63_07635 [Candidatus Delongbacteria bacterium]|nr:hypothetical protein [Candidatus Delongbacteria bacterium]
MKSKGTVSQMRGIFVALLLTILSVCYAQDQYTINHRASGDSGSFSVDKGSTADPKVKITVEEISVSVSGKSDRSVTATAELSVEYPPEVPKTVRAVVRSYADPDFERQVEYEQSEGSEGIYEEKLEDVQESSVPTKLYLEVTVEGETEQHVFWDKNDLESIVSGINNQYGVNLEVVGEGRSVAVRNAAFAKKVEEKSVSRRSYASSIMIENGSYSDVLKFDVIYLEKELVNDAILPKESIGNFTVIIDSSDMYVNGNKIPDRLLVKYRKIFSKFSFGVSDI